ncbi:MAG: GGDEF domain-containing protein [Gammaproteobacteria bacterium]|jgi:diguanylate cyclase (GGDEF)-like protein|nr:GGDEF domain-containing protein [Gammaproteobacteria bacterium]MBT3488766.1 GGDEF domain-containing protein [Gammaproteobacteria bacterium]MBT3719969.1 GGDEF domain-containing protein [Gammaproteobacteria bacterium]MBT3845914.1 GGDEF domain-containing protein [Gammaproteobacteria bacterium]MBT3893261.1 GGDEF domain-containing protein [Gammaproteobacteria bacterium]
MPFWIQPTIIILLLIAIITTMRKLRVTETALANQKDNIDELSHLAFYDELTRLPNRTYFEKHINHAIARAERAQQPLTVLFIDLDNFKPVNERYGHRMGDHILKLVADSIKQSLREVDFPAHLSGDEFIAVLEHTADRKVLKVTAERILQNIRNSTRAVECKHNLSASIGISIYPEHGETAADLMDMADHAMFSAKERGGDNFAFI